MQGFSYYSNQNLITPVYQLPFKTRGTKELLSQHVLVKAKRNGTLLNIVPKGAGIIEKIE
jgi:alpha-L-fucosidase